MAALNTLRTKGGVIVAIVIAFSLIAFLLGDLASSSSTLFNSSNMSVGEMNGKSISYEDYLQKVNYLTEVQRTLYGQQTISEEQSENIKANAWERAAIENSLNESLENLGLITSDEEMVDMTDGEFISPVLSQFFVNQDYGYYDYDAVRRFIATLDDDQTGRNRFVWNYLEEEMLTERSISKYAYLVQNSIFTNNLEVENAVRNTNTSYEISYAGKQLSSIPDSTVTVTDADYQKYYNEHKTIFKQVESREIEYVIFEALPSDADYLAALNTADTYASELAETENVEQYVNLNSELKYIDAYVTEAELNSALAGTSIAEFAMTASNDEVFGPVLESDIYTIARLIDTKNLPDSVGFRQILFAQGTEVLADSIFGAIKSKKITFEEALNTYSIDKQTPGGDMGIISPNNLLAYGDLYEKISNSKKGDLYTANTPYGMAIVETTYQGVPVKKAKLGIVRFSVEPSEKTMRNSYTEATEFVNAAKSDFEKAASTKSKRTARLTANDTNVSGLEKSVEIVRWAFNSNTDDISEIIAVGDVNVVARVTSASDYGYASLDAKTKEMIKPVIVREKKIATLTAEITGSSLEDIASKIDSEVKTVSNINFNSYYVPELGVALNVIGAMTTLPENTISKPMPTATEVVVIKVDSSSETDSATFESQKVVTQTAMEANAYVRARSAIDELANIKDTRVRFF